MVCQCTVFWEKNFAAKTESEVLEDWEGRMKARKCRVWADWLMFDIDGCSNGGLMSSEVVLNVLCLGYGTV